MKAKVLLVDPNGKMKEFESFVLVGIERFNEDDIGLHTIFANVDLEECAQANEDIGNRIKEALEEAETLRRVISE